MKTLHCLVPFCLCLPLGAQALPSPCQPPPERSELRLSALTGPDQDLEPPPRTETSLTRSHAVWRPAVPDEGLALGYGHEYSIVDLEDLEGLGVERLGNDHFHTLYLPLDLSGLLPDDWSLRLQPALAVTSNQLRHLDRIDGHDWQVSAALFRAWGNPARGRWELGLCTDARFGEPLLYPSVAWRLDSGLWSLRLGLPDASLSRRLSSAWDLALQVFPDGNRWRVHDDEGPDSWHEHEAWRAEAVVGWQAARDWRVEGGLGAWLRNEHAFRLTDGRQVEVETDEASYFRLSLVWQWGG